MRGFRETARSDGPGAVAEVAEVPADAVVVTATLGEVDEAGSDGSVGELDVAGSADRADLAPLVVSFGVSGWVYFVVWVRVLVWPSELTTVTEVVS